MVCSVVAEVPQVDHRVGQGLEGIVDIGDDLVANENAPEFVLPSEDAFDGAKRSLKMAKLNKRLGPRLVVFLPRGFSLMLGIMPRLKIALRLALPS